MGYKTKSMLKAVGRNYEQKQQITQGTRPQAGAYSRGNKDFSAVKSAINIPDNFEDAATALGTKIGERKINKEKEAKKLAERKRIEEQASKERGEAGNYSLKIDGNLMNQDNSTEEDKLERLNPNITTSMTAPGRSLNPVIESFSNIGIDLSESFNPPNKKLDPKTGLIMMTAPDAFEKAMKRKARYKK